LPKLFLNRTTTSAFSPEITGEVTPQLTNITTYYFQTSTIRVLISVLTLSSFAPVCFNAELVPSIAALLLVFSFLFSLRLLRVWAAANALGVITTIADFLSFLEGQFSYCSHFLHSLHLLYHILDKNAV
jgi:hypothetical protein